MTQYLLSCECGNSLAVSPGQAGDQIVCPACGQTVEIPSLREMRNLPLTQEQAKSRWFLLPERNLPRSNLSIALGAFLVLVALLTVALMAFGLLEDAFSHSDPSDPRRELFRWNNPSLWGGLALLVLSGLVVISRGMGYAIGPRRSI